jgi:undecaprenyl-diphosphatase
MIEKLIHWDMDLLLFLNSCNSPFFDDIMRYVSEPLTWIPAYILLLYFCIRYYKKQTFIIILFAAVLILITDQVSVQLFKNIFHRLRPSNEPQLEGLVHIVNGYKGGDYGFVSSHATNYFGLAVFFSVLLERNLRFFTISSLLVAGLISYSRIYLGVHYPGDVICGAIMGSLIGFGLGKLYKYLSRKYFSRKKCLQQPE